MEIKNLEKWKKYRRKELLIATVLFVSCIGICIFVDGMNFEFFQDSIYPLYMCIITMYFLLIVIINSQYQIAKKAKNIKNISLISIDSESATIKISWKNGKNSIYSLNYSYEKNVKEVYIDVIGDILYLPLETKLNITQ